MTASSAPRRWPALLAGGIVFLILIGLGTWQVQRLQWKENLLAQINLRTHDAPEPLKRIEDLYAVAADVDYQPVTLSGEFVHSGERAFLATWKGDPGFNIYTPLKLADGRYVFVNRGFVPADLKDPAKRPQGQTAGVVTVTGLARNPLAEKPSSILPDNDPAQNIFFWKDIKAMSATSGIPNDAKVLPFFVDANDAPNPGGLPVGGVTMVDLPNSHLQYAITWYGLAFALVGVMIVWWRKPQSQKESGKIKEL